MSDPSPQPQYVVAQWNGKPPSHTIATVGQLFCWFGTCHHAQTLEAHSQRFGCTVWIPLPCKQWSCRHCAEVKIRHLSLKTETAKPTRLLTLTVDPSRYENPRHAFDETRRKVPELMRFLRVRFGEVEYLRVTELTRRGWPHYHLMLRSPYIPHAVVKSKWNDLTAALIVDLRQIKGSLNTYKYLVKYLSKMHKIGWTERHVSYSRNFFPPDPPPTREDLELTDKVIIEAHPSTYLCSKFRGAKLTALGVNIVALDPQAHALQEITAPDPWPTCSEEPSRDRLFPENTPKAQTPPPQLFPTEHEVTDV